MVVRACRDRLQLIRQLDHALACGRMALEWTGPSGREAPLPFDVVLGIALHDLSWGPTDREPVWDPATSTPVSFLSIEDRARIRLYAEGLDRVERIDDACAMLGSLHYSRFVAQHEDPAFLAREEARRERIAARIAARPAGQPGGGRDDATWCAAADLLRHLDDLSLFVCLAGPDSAECPDWLTPDRVATAPDGARHEPTWRGPDVLALAPFPFRREIRLSIPCRDLPRRRYESAEALAGAWRSATPRFHDVRLVRG